MVSYHIQLRMKYTCCTEACLPSPCINGGVCAVIMDGGSQETFQCVCTPQYTGVYCETASSRTNGTIPCVVTYIQTTQRYTIIILHTPKGDTGSSNLFVKTIEQLFKYFLGIHVT